MSYDLLIGILISIIASSFIIANTANILEKLLQVIQKHLLKLKMKRAIKEMNITEINEGLINNSIMKLRSKETEKRKIAVKELFYEWQLADKSNKDKIIQGLINMLQKECNPNFRREIISLLYKLTSEDL